MKIAINNYCNSKCPYCFAGNMGIDKNSNISVSDFKTLLDMMVRDKDNYVVLLGGEPTLHPQFKDILSAVNEYCSLYSWNFLFLTNGVKLGDYLDLFDKKTLFLINVNSWETLGQKQFKKMIDSLDKLKEKGFLQTGHITLGCNIHAENDNYDYFWNIVDKYSINKIRVSVASPHNNESYLSNRDLYFRSMKATFLAFMLEAQKRKVFIHLDCSQIPYCYFSVEELNTIAKITNGDITSLGKCVPMFEVMPDMTTSCCFGDDGFKSGKKSIYDFKNIYEIEKYYENKRIKQSLNCFPFQRCDKCLYKRENLCTAGCFGFKDIKP